MRGRQLAAPAGLGVRRAARRDPAGAFPAGRGGGADPRLGEGGRGGRVRVAVAQACRGAQGHRLHHRLKHDRLNKTRSIEAYTARRNAARAS